MTAYRSIIWARRQPPSNDFLHTIRALASQGLIEFKHSGFAAAIVSAYLRDKDRLKVERGLFSGWNREARISGAGRRVFRVRLVAMPRACESAYGVTYLIKFLDLDTGALLTTFASEGIAEARPDSIALGSEFEIKATLGNKTRSFNGAAETSISRVAWPSPALAT